MEIRKFVRSILVISLLSFVITSCVETDGSTGSGLIPDDYYISLHKAEFDVPVQMKMSDNIRTNASAYAIIGSVNDPDFGMTESAAAFSFIPANNSLSYGDNPIPKSLSLFITGISSHAYSDRDNFIHQNIYVHSLNSGIDSLETVYNNSIKAGDYDSAPLNIGGGNVFFGSNPDISINLSLDYARELLAATEDEREDRYTFMKRYNGLYLRTDPVLSSYIGGRLCYIPMTQSLGFSSSMGLSLTYWHVDSDIPDGKDSTLFYYAYSLTNVNNITHSSASLESDNPVGPIFLEGIAGIKPYIDFSEIKGSVDTWAASNQIDLSKVIVVKAELLLHYDAPDDYSDLPRFYPETIFLNTLQKDRDSEDKYRYIPIEDILIYSDPSGGVISNLNRSKELYSFNISSHFQRFIKGELTEDDLRAWVMPNMILSDNNGQAMGFAIENMIFHKIAFFGANDVKKPKLILTYALSR